MDSNLKSARIWVARAVSGSTVLRKTFHRLALDEVLLERLVADPLFLHRLLNVDSVLSQLSGLLDNPQLLDLLIASNDGIVNRILEKPVSATIAASNTPFLGRLFAEEKALEAIANDAEALRSFLGHANSSSLILHDSKILAAIMGRRELLDAILSTTEVTRLFLEDQRTIDAILTNESLLARIVNRGASIEALIASERTLRVLFERLGRSEPLLNRVLEISPAAVRGFGRNARVQNAVLDSPEAPLRASAHPKFLKRLRAAPIDYDALALDAAEGDSQLLEHKGWMNTIYVDQFLRFLAAKGFECRTVLDVGAHKGHWSEGFKKVYPDAAVFMIEPIEEMQAHLTKFCEAHPGSRFRIAGAGPKSGEMEITVWPTLSGSTFMANPGDKLDDSYVRRTVPIVTVDELVAKGELDVPEFIKLDVQGFELEVLKGANSVLGTTQVVLMEVSLFDLLGSDMPTMADVVHFMHERGYVPYDIVGFYRRRKDHALGQCDMVFALKNSPLREYRGLTRKFDWDYMRYSE